MLVLGSVRGRRLFAHVYCFFNENAMQHHPNGTSKAQHFQYSHGKYSIFETMTFHDFGPCRAPKMKPSRRRILIVDFCFKTPARINIPPFQTTSTHQNHSQHTLKSSKIAHPKIMRIHWSEDPSKAPKSSFTKHQ